MKPDPTLQTRPTRSSKGFALVVSLAMMVLLTIIAVGLLSLSSISIRTTAQTSAMAEAQANARLALMIAIGELQKHTGADTRITAPSEIVEPGSPPIVGAWRSWEGLNHETTGNAAGRPIQPDYDLKTQVHIGVDPDNGTANGRFLSWLISTATEGENLQNPSVLASTAAAGDGSTVPLLAEGSLGTNPGQIHVTPNLTGDESGAFAWWISPENQKAKLKQPHEPRNGNAAGWVGISKSHAVPDPKIFGLDSLLNDLEDYNPSSNNPKSARKAITLATTELLENNNPSEPHVNFHDLSTSAVGLLTNSATGGWRKDLSILSERWDTIYTSYIGGRLPLFRLSPTVGGTSLVPKPMVPANTTTNATTATIAPSLPDGSLFYPWSRYPTKNYIAATGGSTNGAIAIHGATTSWASLIDYATSYKTITYNSASKTGSVPINAHQSRVSLRAGGADSLSGAIKTSDVYNYLHRVRKSPVLGRVQWTFSVRARRNSPASNDLRYQINFLATPIITLWNPYNVAIDINESFGLSLDKSPPLAMAFVKSTTTTPYPDSHYRRFTQGTINNGNPPNHYDVSISKYANSLFGNDDLNSIFPSPMTLAPGEARVFSAPDGVFTSPSQNMVAGYSGLPSGFQRINNGGGSPFTDFLSNDILRIAMKFDNITSLGAQTDTTKQGPGIMLNFGRRGNGGWSPRVVDYCTNYTMMTSLDFSQTYWQRPSDLPELPISVIAIDDTSNPAQPTTNPPWTPVFSIVFGPKLTIGSGINNDADRPTKGVLQNSPFVGATQISSVSSPNNHPANGAYDFSFFGHLSGSSDTIPDNSASAGYIFSGNTAAKGLSRLILSEIPLQPMASLAELQGWDLRAHNIVPPFQYNIIGNSNAVPMMPKENVIRSDASAADINLQHDDAYCANHLLFDDWFFSSIAAEPQDFGSNNPKAIDVVYREFLKGERRLANRAYLPIPDDSSVSDSEATTRIGQIINSPDGDGWLKVASRLEVDGMFNVNSTSVKAWRAILGHSRNKQIARYTTNGIDAPSTEEDHTVSRYPIASDIKASSAPGMGGAFPNSSEYTGYRTLTDAQMDDLATKIVEQVRSRGPFLSLAEFVNRQLSTNDDFALAGAIQTALENLDVNPNQALTANGVSSPTMPISDPKLNGVGYEYTEAAEGYNSFGLPGWVRQADILRPIAPILSARDDTFTIRAYGDARDASGNIIARAWCEATVSRGREFVDSEDPADSINPPLNSQNLKFGRKYKISRFRWLTAKEV